MRLSTPLAAFNGGTMVDPDMTVIEQRAIPSELVGAMIALLESFALSAWVYRGDDWYVRDLHGPRVERESLHRAVRAHAGRELRGAATMASPRSSG